MIERFLVRPAHRILDQCLALKPAAPTKFPVNHSTATQKVTVDGVCVLDARQTFQEWSLSA